MKIVLQRVSSANVTINQERVAEIATGFLVLLGIVEDDTQEDIDYLVRKIINLRIFDDQNGLMNNSVLEVDGEIIVVSQFTLYASTKKGNRPSYIKAAKPTIAIPLYKKFIKTLENQLGKSVGKGEFGADMKVSLTNNGPVTIVIDSKNKE
ncbi:D-aminoacyl-tRNA deacylase [Polaribacter tangerinus]|uniref:D-aminoacyl-tRNA deacylase n=1 Tax=Polaribacter tangerinus TaxID=1920034 RepID=UPI000B4A7A03|nr:D-aminoacyl-tRNA deacylase [Polaribacter tangerinus]